MAITVTKLDQGTSGLVQEIHHLDWSSTTATVELPTGLTEIYGSASIRVDAIDVSDMSSLSIDETITLGIITVDADGEITVIRTQNLAAGTLVAEHHILMLWGKS